VNEKEKKKRKEVKWEKGSEKGLNEKKG
jgi:hypothetical protein